MMHCESCGSDFEHPDIYQARENLDRERGVWLHIEESCPYCGSEFLKERKDEDAENIDARHEPRRMA